jgi:nitrogen fixation NifU-like protein
MIKGEEIDNEECLEEALVYQGVSKFPARIKCATISWKALEDLIGEAKSEGK